MGQLLSVVAALCLIFVQEVRAACSDEPLWQAFVARARTIAEEQCSCDTATSNASYVACVEGSLNTTISQGLLPESCRATVVDAATLSTCGSAGALACCTPDGGGANTCAVVPAAQCTGSSYAGISESCYDACTSLPRCAQLPTAGDEAAMNNAYDHIVAAHPNVVTDENLFRLMYHQTAVEEGCWQSHRMKNFRPRGGTGGFARQSLPKSKSSGQTSAFSSSGPCPDSNCMPPYQDADTYCGPGQNNFLTTNCDSPCLNHACYRHDGCTRDHCTRLTCVFSTDGDCDSCFDGQCGACRDAYEVGGVEESEEDAYTCTRRVCWAAKKIGSITRDGCVEDPDYCDCNGDDCAHCSYCAGCPAGSGAGQCGIVSNISYSNVMHSAKVIRSSYSCLSAVQAGCGNSMVKECSASARADVRYYNCAGYWRDSCSGQYDSNLTCDTPCNAGPCEESLARQAAWDDERSCAESKGFPLFGGTPPVSPPSIWLRRTGACCIPPQ